MKTRNVNNADLGKLCGLSRQRIDQLRHSKNLRVDARKATLIEKHVGVERGTLFAYEDEDDNELVAA